MKSCAEIHLSDVQSVYSGPERQLWELLMGEQIHIGGFQSSMDLAERAGVGHGQKGVDLCCATGAGMRFLLRFRGVSRMTGVDATQAMLELGRQRCADEGLADRVKFVEGDVCSTGLPTGEYDFVWGEDAWCYVEDKKRLIGEAVRLIKSKGLIAFTDWMEGPVGLSADEAQRYLAFMKFPSVLGLTEYSALLEASGCHVRLAQDSGRFAGHARLYLAMLELQLSYDACKILGWNVEVFRGLITELRFIQALAEAQKIIQGIVIAQFR